MQLNTVFGWFQASQYLKLAFLKIFYVTNSVDFPKYGHIHMYAYILHVNAMLINKMILVNNSNSSNNNTWRSVSKE